MQKFDKELFREVADSIECKIEELIGEDPLIREAVQRIKERKETNGKDTCKTIPRPKLGLLAMAQAQSSKNRTSGKRNENISWNTDILFL